MVSVKNTLTISKGNDTGCVIAICRCLMSIFILSFVNFIKLTYSNTSRTDIISNSDQVPNSYLFLKESFFRHHSPYSYRYVKLYRLIDTYKLNIKD